MDEVMSQDKLTVQGVLELHPKGFGFLRNPARHYAAQPADPYVSAPLIQKFGLREGLLVGGPTEMAKTAAGPRLAPVEQLEGQDPEKYRRRNFDDLTPIDPHEQIVLETGAQPLTTRVMDLLAPIGKGQRGLIVAPPRTGKTILLQHIAQAVAQNHPEMHVMMLLVDERPEEVTDMRRTVKGEVIASSSDRDSISHVRLAELVVDRKLADRRIYPAMEITQSGTRKEERILPAEVLQRVTLLRRSLVSLNPVSAMESLVQQLAKYPSNAAFLDKVGTFVR